MTKPNLAALIWKDGPAVAPSQPPKNEIRQWGTYMEGVVDAFTSNGGLIYDTMALLQADTGFTEKRSAWVINDATVSNNGVYGFDPSSHTWARKADLPFSIIVGNDAGAGTENAIQVTTAMPVSASSIVRFEVAKTNTAEGVTIAFNGASPMPIKTNSGNDVSAGGLIDGMVLLGAISNGAFRLQTDQSSTAVVAAAEAARDAAQQASDQANGLVGKAGTALQPEDIGNSIPSYTDTRLGKADQLPSAAARDRGSSLYSPGNGSFLINRIQELSCISDVPDVVTFTAAELDNMYDMLGTIDVADKIQAVVNFAQSYGMTLKIPRIGALLSKQISHDSRLNVECDDHAFLQWNTRASCGWKVVGYLAGNAPGYGHVRLPHMIGPNDISGYTGSATTNSYSTAGFDSGSLPCVGLDIEDYVWGKFEIMRSSGWGSAARVKGANYGSFNLDLKLGTIDLCKYGVYFAPSNGKPVAQSRITADNIFALYPLFFDVSAAGGGAIFEWIINALGLHVAELNGSCIYTKGVTMSSPYTMTDVRVDAKAENGYFSNDSPNNVPPAYLGPIIGGDQTGPASVAGYEQGARNRFRLHLNDRVPSIYSTFKSKGSDIIEVTAPTEQPVNPLTSILMSQTVGLANFNGGKPLIHKKSRLSLVTSGDLAANASTDFFFYHEATRSDANIPMFSVVQRDNQNGLQVYVLPEGTAEGGRQRVRIRNESGATISAGAALNFHVYTIT